MASTVLISVLCADRTGLVAAIAGHLFDLGGNLGDTSFSVLGGAAEFTALCELPDDVALPTVEMELSSLPELTDADISVTPFGLSKDHGPDTVVTHHIVVDGGDQPGLIARLCEVFVTFKANIVRLHAQTSGQRYAVDLDVSIPEGSEETCLATVANTAGELALDCRWWTPGDQKNLSVPRS